LNRNPDKNKILIVSGGFINEEFLKSLISKEGYSLIIAADRGLEALNRINVMPDFILGDFDSAGTDILSEYRNKSIPVITYPSHKDDTDTQLALELALEQNPEVIDITGATGNRLDHTMANIGLLGMTLEKNVDARILDPNNKIYLKDNNFIIKKENQYGDFVSFLPFNGRVKGLKLKGFKYPLDGITLDAASSLCISNEIMDDEAKIEFEEGILIVFETRD